MFLKLMHNKLIKRFLVSLVLFLTVLFINGCVPKDIEVTGISLDKQVVFMYEGEQSTVIATVVPDNATNKIVSWDSADKAIATVDNGVITGVTVGSTTITAEVGELSASVEVFVQLKATDIVLNYSNDVMEVGDIMTVSAVVKPNTVADKTITWSSSNDSIATVDNGKVTAISQGDVKISATASGFTKTVDLKVVSIISYLTYELNGGNFTYTSRTAMAEDFIADYNTWGGTDYTLDSLPMGAFVNNNFHGFLLDENYKDKWIWLPTYLSVVGSSANKKACQDLLISTSPSNFNSKNGNHIYALSYEVRGFIKGIKYSENANWISSDYSEPNLKNGFWNTFIENNEITKHIIQDSFTLTKTVFRGGYDFLGWYDNPEFTGNPISSVTKETKVYAKWELTKPVTAIKITNPIETLIRGKSHHLFLEFTPIDAFDKTVKFSTSDEKIIKVDQNGNVTALNPGTATITVKSLVTGVTTTLLIEVPKLDDIGVGYDNWFNGTLKVEEDVNVIITGIGALSNKNFTFTSLTPEKISVNGDGLITGLAIGNGSIIVKLGEDTILTINITIVGESSNERIDKLVELLANANFAVVDALNVSLFYEASLNQQYFDSTYGSVNLFLFDDINYNTDKPWLRAPRAGKKSSTEFITVHDTANLYSGLTGHGDYFLKTTDSISIHYIVGDGGVIQSMDRDYITWHAGDGTQVQFKWNDTGIKANGNFNPILDISTDGYFTFNGEKSTVLAPKDGTRILDKSYFSNNGPQWKIGTDGNYYIGESWFNKSQNARGVISSHGGNLNSTGIEMCINTPGDIYDTWQRTAKLVGELLILHELDLSRVLQHNDFSGKNCPQTLIMTDYWNVFMKMVALEYEIQTKYSDAKITLTSNNPDIINNKGRVISEPKLTTAVTYTITVTIGEASKSIILGSVIPGTNSWSQLNGMFNII